MGGETKTKDAAARLLYGDLYNTAGASFRVPFQSKTVLLYYV